MMKYLLLLLLACSMPCYATIYMQEDAQGNITYSDTPLENGHVLNAPEQGEGNSANFQITPELNTGDKTSEPAEPNKAATAEQTVEEEYESFAIISPKDQENIQNQPNLIVDLKVEPKLKADDKIQILLDGKLAGNPSAETHIVLGQPERGTHKLSAIIVDKNQKVIQQTNPITIYVNRVNVNFKPGNSAAAVPEKPKNSTSLISIIKRLIS